MTNTDVAPDPAKYLPTVLVHAAFDSTACRLERLARTTGDPNTEAELMDLAGELRRAVPGV